MKIPPAIHVLPSLSPVARRDAARRILDARAGAAAGIRSDTMQGAHDRYGVRRLPAKVAWDLSVFSSLVREGVR